MAEATDIAERALALVALVHEGVFEPTPWQRFLRALRGQAGAGYANVIFRHPGAPDDGLTEWVDADDDPQAIRDHYFASFAGRDPFPYFRMEPGRIMRMPELMGDPDFRRKPYFTDFLKPQGLEHMLLFRAVEPGGHQAWVTLTRPLDGQDFAEETARLCARIVPHFAIALRAYGELEAARITRGVRDRALRPAGLACVTVDLRRIVVHGDTDRLGTAADRPVHLDGGRRLRLAHAEADRRFGRALADIDRGHLTAPQTMPCGSDADEQILLEPLPCHLRRTHGAIANVYFRDAGADTPDTAAFRGALRRIYGLSANEATLACLLAGGATLADAARQIGLTEESARTYSKRIFAKTGTSRQPALVSLLLRSIATLA